MNSIQHSKCNSASAEIREGFPLTFPKAGISPLVSIPGIATASVTFCKFLSFLLPDFPTFKDTLS